MKKWIVTLCVCLAFGFLCSMFSIETKAADEIEDPLYGRVHGKVDRGFYEDDEVGKYSKNSFDTLEMNDGRKARKGIDVSKWQGDINWTDVKKSGVEFVIVRVGYRGSSNGALAEDSTYVKNIEGALGAGLKVGVYFFSQAISEDEARQEADFLIERIYKYNIQLPLVIDYEYAAGNTGRLYDAHLTKQQATSVVDAFCSRVIQAGYSGMVYANKSMLTNGLNANELAQKYRIWLANYQTPQMSDFGNPVTTYTGKYDFFQFSSKGRVSGIKGDVDLNYWYDDGTISGKDYSAVFDPIYYADRYPDLKSSFGYDAYKLLDHFITFGMNEGRQGNKTFNVYSYKNQYPDLRRSYLNNLPEYYFHYMNYGRYEGRSGIGSEGTLVGALSVYGGIDYSAVYDYNYYISKYQDIYNEYASEMDDVGALEHFVCFGMKEGRQAKSDFNVYSYKNQYPDLRRSYNNDLPEYYFHFIDFGRYEGRTGTGSEEILVGAVTTYGGIDYSAVYDYNYYISKYPDIYDEYGSEMNDAGALEHFVISGMKEGRQAKSDFNVYSYKNKYPDLRAAFGKILKEYYFHFIDFGIYEGRIGTGSEEILVGAVTTYGGIDYSAVYDYNYYISKYPDIYDEYGSKMDDIGALEHFVISGMKEGRQASQQFNVRSYQQRYADLYKTFGDDLQKYYLHYLTNGINEGRDGH